MQWAWGTIEPGIVKETTHPKEKQRAIKRNKSKVIEDKECFWRKWPVGEEILNKALIEQARNSAVTI